LPKQPCHKHDIRGFVRSGQIPRPHRSRRGACPSTSGGLINADACILCHWPSTASAASEALQFRDMMDANNMDYAIFTYNAPK
jgi:hypothetical protein